jgi:hypothetical protein
MERERGIEGRIRWTIVYLMTVRDNRFYQASSYEEDSRSRGGVQWRLTIMIAANVILPRQDFAEVRSTGNYL